MAHELDASGPQRAERVNSVDPAHYLDEPEAAASAFPLDAQRARTRRQGWRRQRGVVGSANIK